MIFIFTVSSHIIYLKLLLAPVFLFFVFHTMHISSLFYPPLFDNSPPKLSLPPHSHYRQFFKLPLSFPLPHANTAISPPFRYPSFSFHHTEHVFTQNPALFFSSSSSLAISISTLDLHLSSTSVLSTSNLCSILYTTLLSMTSHKHTQ